MGDSGTTEDRTQTEVTEEKTRTETTEKVESTEASAESTEATPPAGDEEKADDE